MLQNARHRFLPGQLPEDRLVAADVGVNRKPLAGTHQQLEIHCGYGLFFAVPDYSIGFGYSVRFQMIQSNSQLTTDGLQPFFLQSG
jgi:hypothetical protein